MERRLKERLTGAIVLVALAVIVIPSLLDGPDQPAVSRPLTLPGADGAATRSRTIVLGAEPSATAGSNAAAADVPAPRLSPPIQPPRGSAPAASSPASARPPAAAPASAPAADPVVDRGPAPASGSKAEPAAVTGWAVQVGSFSNETNARRLAQSLTRTGYPAFVARHVVNGVVRFRVRVGPEPERERADALAARLKKDGQQTRVVPHPE